MSRRQRGQIVRRFKIDEEKFNQAMRNLDFTRRPDGSFIKDTEKGNRLHFEIYVDKKGLLVFAHEDLLRKKQRKIVGVSVPTSPHKAVKPGMEIMKRIREEVDTIETLEKIDRKAADIIINLKNKYKITKKIETFLQEDKKIGVKRAAGHYFVIEKEKDKINVKFLTREEFKKIRDQPG